MNVPPLPRPTGGRFFEAYTRGLTTADLERLFTRDAPEAYRFFSRHVDFDELKNRPWHLRMLGRVRMLFLAFTLKLTPARRVLYGSALVASLIGLIELFQSFHLFLIPHPAFAPGTLWLLTGFLLVNLLVLLEVADRLSLKNDLEIAREIQQAMLPRGEFRTLGVEAFGMTRPANTVGGDFYDILPLADGRVLLALGDVAGKGSPAALLMALLLAMLRTLVDEGLEDADLAARLNVQIVKHAPRSRFVTLFIGTFDPRTGSLVYVNAGQNPPLLRRTDGSYERLRAGGMALGMFENATYSAGRVELATGDVLVMYSDGITEAEDPAGRPFEERGLELVVDRYADQGPADIGVQVLKAVEAHAKASRFIDDLTILLLKRGPRSPTISA